MRLIKNVIGANCRKQPQKRGFMNEEGVGADAFLSERQRLHMLGKARQNVILSEDGTRRERWRSGDRWKKIKRGRRLRTSEGKRSEDKDREEDLQFKGLVPGGVEAALDGLGLLLALVARVRDQLQLHVGVWQTVGVHGNQILALFDWEEEDRRRSERWQRKGKKWRLIMRYFLF